VLRTGADSVNSTRLGKGKGVIHRFERGPDKGKAVFGNFDFGRCVFRISFDVAHAGSHDPIAVSELSIELIEEILQ
jgi:hypothetical protein